MKVLVIGATGRTGRLAVQRLLAQGDAVTAFARDPSAVSERHDHLTVVKGDARDRESISHAVRGQDAVLVTFGGRSLKKDDIPEVICWPDTCLFRSSFATCLPISRAGRRCCSPANWTT